MMKRHDVTHTLGAVHIHAVCPGCMGESDVYIREDGTGHSPAEAVWCRHCGERIPLRDTVPAIYECRSCGAVERGSTNRRGGTIYARCPRCGGWMTSRWHGKLRRFVPEDRPADTGDV